MLIHGTFDSRTLADMNAALDRVCGRIAQGEEHAVRRRVARQIVLRARRGNATLADLTAAGQRGLLMIASSPD